MHWWPWILYIWNIIVDRESIYYYSFWRFTLACNAIVILLCWSSYDFHLFIAGGSSSRAADRNFQGLTVERLRALLKEKGLSLKGKKASASVYCIVVMPLLSELLYLAIVSLVWLAVGLQLSCLSFSHFFSLFLYTERFPLEYGTCRWRVMFFSCLLLQSCLLTLGF